MASRISHVTCHVSASTVVMCEPRDFCYNAETGDSNAFSKDVERQESVQQQALVEWSSAVKTLREYGVKVLTMTAPADRKTPDGVFPNNWFSTTRKNDGVDVILYPMEAESRRAEVQREKLEEMLNEHYRDQQKNPGDTDSTVLRTPIDIKSIIQMRDFSKEIGAVEGTGVIIFDHYTGNAFVSLSSRANKEMCETIFKEALVQFRPIFFTSYDKEGREIYHTNVMMSIGNYYAVVCLECIRDEKEREEVKNALLQKSDRELIDITHDQMGEMCGNVLELSGNDPESGSASKNGSVSKNEATTDGRSPSALIVMSKTAFNAFTERQKEVMQKSSEFVILDIPTIEKIGGGSARCMLAEIF